MYLCISIAGQPQIDSQDAKYHSDVASLQHDGPLRGTTSSGISNQDTGKNDGIPPTAVIPTATTQAASTLTSPPAHAPSTTSEKSLTNSITSAASDVSAARPHLSSSSSTASVSSHSGSEVQGTDQRSTLSSASTATNDQSATHSHSTINILFVSKPSTTAQSGELYLCNVCVTTFIVNSPTH